jgi:hypothetical protein
VRAFATLVALVLTVTAVAGQEPTINEVLARAADYVAAYTERLAGIVAEEHYRQQVISTSRPGRPSNREFRELRSDLLLVKPADRESWLQFRDVFEVDRQPIRDRDQRLYKLFIDAKSDASEHAATIQAESARFNIGPIRRTVNIPMLALLFFERDNQARVQFARARAENVKPFLDLAKAEDIWMLEFRETGPGTMVKGELGRDVPSHGRAWIDSVTGRILRTEQISEDTSVRAVIDVSYRSEKGLDLLVPAEMRENYLVRRSEVRIDGRAIYSRFRQFTVTTTEKPKPQ